MSIQEASDEKVIATLEKLLAKVEQENRDLRSRLREAQIIAEEQADDTSLWLTGETPREEKLSKELGRIHMVLRPGTVL